MDEIISFYDGKRFLYKCSKIYAIQFLILQCDSKAILLHNIEVVIRNNILRDCDDIEVKQLEKFVEEVMINEQLKKELEK